MTSRSYCFTLNNPTPSEQLNIEDATCRYLIFGIEKENTLHLQGYIEFAKPQRISAVKKIPGFARAHLEIRRGTREEARDYCMKGGDWLEFGSWEEGGRGSRNDLTRLMNLVKNQTPTLEIMQTIPDTYAHNMRFAEKYQALIEKEQTKEFRTVETHLLIGEAGVGKSRLCRELAPNAFTVNPEDAFPFDGYDGEKEIIIDDFEGQLKYKHLLKILDGHQLRVNVKGSHRYARWTKIFITTNEKPESWYQRGLTPALKRRLSLVTTICNDEAGNTEPPLEI